MPDLSKDDVVREIILHAAKRVFRKWGLNKTTMEDIAHEAGKGKSTLYYYFVSKDEIFDAVVRAELSGVLQRSKAAVQNVTSAKEKLRTYVMASFAELKNTATLYDIVREEIKGNPHFNEIIQKQFEESEETFLKGILTLGAQQKEFMFADERELATAARVVLNIMRALELYFFLEHFDADHVDMAARLIADGI
ncbi:MAG: TetR/AcrR family transcriptional regulator [Bacteroidetes bacterium]|jgi:AcrR family transcriptional regulator|nr:TetR/AcrR family transcriptional regulator [Bacteroidota bacterium]